MQAMLKIDLKIAEELEAGPGRKTRHALPLTSHHPNSNPISLPPHITKTSKLTIKNSQKKSGHLPSPIKRPPCSPQKNSPLPPPSPYPRPQPPARKLPPRNRVLVGNLLILLLLRRQYFRGCHCSWDPLRRNRATGCLDGQIGGRSGGIWDLRAGREGRYRESIFFPPIKRMR